MSKISARSPRKSQSAFGQRVTSRKEEALTHSVNSKKSEDDETTNEPLIENSISSVHSACSNAAYPTCVWSREHLLKSSSLTKLKLQRYHPHGVSEHGELTLVGKTRYRFRNGVSDKLGVARKSTQTLEIDHLGRLVNLDSFVVLGFDVIGCFEWSKSLRWALKVGYDVQRQEVIYMTRRSSSSDVKRGGDTTRFGIPVLKLSPITDSTSSSIGPDFDLLTLKPSPKSLKCQVRDYLRKREPLAGDNLQLDQFDLLLESTLIHFIKYPSRLKLGSELQIGESLVSADRNYRLSLEADGRLILYLDSTRLKHLYLLSQVDSLWFYDLAIVVSHKQSMRTSVFPNSMSSHLITEFLSGLAWCKNSIVLRLKNDGTFEIGSREHDTKLVIQYRDDVKSMWNAAEPKFECMCFVVKKDPNESDDEEDSTDDDDDDDEDDEEGEEEASDDNLKNLNSNSI